MKSSYRLSIVGWLFACLSGGYHAQAQTTGEQTETTDGKKETQEIIIRKNGEKDTKLTLEITGDKIIINGKPLAEFNESGLTINNRKIIIRDGDKLSFDFGKKINDEIEQRLQFEFDKSFDNNMGLGSEKTYTFLGVSSEKTGEGALITDVTKNSPAEKAGLQKNDIIYRINDQAIESPASLSNVVRAMKTGDKVKVYFIRNGKKKEEKVTLAENKIVNASTRVFSYTNPDGSVKTLTIPRPPMPPAPPGFEKNWENNFGDNIFEPRRQKLGLKILDTEDGNGVKILEVEAGSASAVAGLLKDDILTEIGAAKVQNTDDAREQLQENAEKSNYNIKAKRNGNEMTFSIKIPKKLKTANL
jgi:serine protease Do